MTKKGVTKPCRICGLPVPQIPRRREKFYCDNACKQAAYRRNRAKKAATR